MTEKEFWVIQPVTEDNVFKATGVQRTHTSWWFEDVGWLLWDGKNIFENRKDALYHLKKITQEKQIKLEKILDYVEERLKR